MKVVRVFGVLLLLCVSLSLGCSGGEPESADAENTTEEITPKDGPKMIPPTVGDNNG